MVDEDDKVTHSDDNEDGKNDNKDNKDVKDYKVDINK